MLKHSISIVQYNMVQYSIDQIVLECLVLGGISILLSIVAVPVYTNNLGGFLCPHILRTIYIDSVFLIDILTEMR